ncbi:hypothetical protein ACLB2K_046312 [Fragaria x ananassa]
MEAFALLLDVEQSVYSTVDAGVQYETVDETFRELVEAVYGVGWQAEEPTECLFREGLLEGVACYGVAVARGATKLEERLEVEMRVSCAFILIHLEGLGSRRPLLHLHSGCEGAWAISETREQGSLSPANLDAFNP